MDLDPLCKSILSGLGEAVCAFDLDGKVLYLNPSAERLIKRSLQDSAGKSPSQIFGDLDPEGRIEVATKRKGQSCQGVLEVENKSLQFSLRPLLAGKDVTGSIIYIQPHTGAFLQKSESYPIKAIESADIKAVEDGEGVELLCTGNEITERKLAKQSLEATHEQLLGIIEFLPDATFVIDKDRKVIAWNKAIEEMTGVVKEQVLGKGNSVYSKPFFGVPKPMLVDLINANGKDIESRHLFVEKKDGRIYTESFVSSLFEGKGAYIWATASPLFDSGGNIIGAIESIRDITDQKLAEETLKRKDNLLAGVAVAANSLLQSQDYDTDICQALEILGLSANVDRIYIFENRLLNDGHIVASQIFEWCREGIKHPLDNPCLKAYPYDRFLSRWHDILSYGDVINGLVKDFSESERSIFEPRGVISLIAVPIAIAGEFWGFVCFEDCHSEKTWSKSEISILRVAAGSIGATVERKLAEDELCGTRDYLENLISHASSPIIVWDPSFRITRFNRAFERLTGLSADEVLGKSLEVLFALESKDESLKYLHRTLSGERWEAVEIPILREDGSVRTVLWNSATIYEKDGNTVLATIAHGQDITERNQAQEQVQFQASLLDQVHNAVIATDLYGRIVYWNKFAEDLHQWTAEEVIGKSIAEITVPEGKTGRMRELMKQIASMGYYEGELQVRRKDGSTFPSFYGLNVLKDARGRKTGFVGISIDITERKRAEEDLRRAKEKAELATKAKSDFLANMSHEIRTPMNAVIGLTGLLLNTQLTTEQRDYVETIRGSGDALMAVINDILDFSKIEGGKLEMEFQPFDLVECLEASLDLVSQGAAMKGLTLSYSVDSQVPHRIIGDVTRLRQVLVNLLSNAVKFTEHGDISVKVSSCSDGPVHHIQFAVRDTGIGIARDRMDRLFQLFSQVDTSINRKYGGTGLGLAISKRLVEMMGGAIWAESEPNKGSTFCFIITTEEDPVPLAELAGKKVLVLSKDENIEPVLMRQLESWSMEVVVMNSAGEAREKIVRERFNVIILDPEVEGVKELIEEKRSTRSPPLVILGPGKMDNPLIAASIERPIRASRLGEALVKALKTPLLKSMPLRISSPEKRKALRVLLAEDNAVNQKVALRMLERLGYRADIAANGFEVLQALKLQPYDVVLMDVQMPDMDGLEATRRIRSLKRIRQPYIIAMTAYAMKGDREECIEAGMNDYVSKPVRIEELQAALERRNDPGEAIDKNVLVELRKLQMEGEPDIVEELAEMYLERAPSRINAMKGALARGEKDVIFREAHNLKSSSANLGAMQLSSICKDLEAMGRSGVLDGAEELIKRAEEEFRLVKAALMSEMPEK